MEIGTRGHDLPGTDAAALFTCCKELGIGNVQLALAKSFPDICGKPGVFSPGLAAAVRREMDKNAVRISVLGCYIDPVHPEDALRQQQLDRFAEHMLFAKYLGADMIGTETGAFAGWHTEETRSEAAYQRLLEGFLPLVARAEKLGVMIGIEPVTGHTLYCPARLKRFFDDINSPNLCAIFDPVNLLDITNYHRQQQIMEEAFAAFGDRMAVLHLKDFVVTEGQMQIRLAGDGMLDMAYLAALVKERKPELDIILEEVPKQDWHRVREQVAGYFA